jgi:hypothetical protein
MRQKATWKIMEVDKYLTGSKEDFDAWIRDTIDKDANKGGVFPGSNVFIERVRSKRKDGQDE